jgi:dTDP-4-amino-4,6-dideoxygalactose transaminase
MNQPTRLLIPFHRPSLGEQEEQAVLRVLRSGWLTTAGEAQAFEREFASLVGSPHAIAVTSATAGLHLALEALGVGPGDRVVTTPYTFTSTAEVIRYLGADPLFVDVLAEDLTIDPKAVARALELEQTAHAVIPVHFGGHPCRMDELCAAADAHHAPVLEDAAHALPGTSAGRPLGTLGAAGVYSFYATKTITTGEGGMVVTHDESLARRMRTMRLHGIDRDVWDRYTSDRPSWEYDVVAPGYKYNLPDLLAAIGRVQLGKAHAFRQARQAVAGRYRELLGACDYLTLPPDSDESSWHLYVIRLRPEKTRTTRDQLMHALADRGVGTSLHYKPLHLFSYYRDRYGLRPEDFPVSLQAYQCALSLPIYPGLSEESCMHVARSIRDICESGPRG